MTNETSSPDYVAPTVFISYSWTSDEYADQIKQVAERLVNDGIDVVLDRWDLKIGQDKFAFMEQMVNDAKINKVVIMCDKLYAERADKRIGGVGTESTIISEQVYNNVKQDKFIPVITERSPEGDTFLPTFIKSRIYADISDPKVFERGYEDLWRAITGRPASRKPPLGKPPAYLLETDRPTSPTTFAMRTFESALTSGKSHSTGLARDYLDRLFETLLIFQIDLSEISETDVRDSQMLKRLEDWTPLRNELMYFLRLICRYGTDQRLYDLLPAFFELCLKMTRLSYQHQWTQHLRFIVHEAFLYTIAGLLQEERFEAVAVLLNFHYRDPERTVSTQRYGIFSQGDERQLQNLLNEKWSQQEGHKYKYPQHQWLSRRVVEGMLSFDQIVEADVVLWLRFHLERDRSQFFDMLSWYPITLGSMDDFGFIHQTRSFPLFQRATSKTYFEQLKTVLSVETREDFLQKFDDAFPRSPERSWDGVNDYWRRSFNVEGLATKS